MVHIHEYSLFHQVYNTRNNGLIMKMCKLHLMGTWRQQSIDIRWAVFEGGFDLFRKCLHVKNIYKQASWHQHQEQDIFWTASLHAALHNLHIIIHDWRSVQQQEGEWDFKQWEWESERDHRSKLLLMKRHRPINRQKMNQLFVTVSVQVLDFYVDWTKPKTSRL